MITWKPFSDNVLLKFLVFYNVIPAGVLLATMDRLSRFAVMRLGVGGHVLNEKRFRVIPVSGAFVILRRTLPPLHRAPASDKACCAFSCIDRNLRHNYNTMFTLPSPVLCFYFYAHVLCLGVKNSPTRLIRKKTNVFVFFNSKPRIFDHDKFKDSRYGWPYCSFLLPVVVAII